MLLALLPHARLPCHPHAHAHVHACRFISPLLSDPNDVAPGAVALDDEVR